MLEDHADFFANFINIRSFMRNVFTVNQDLAACHRFKTIDHPQNGTFPGTRRPDHDNNFIVCNV